MVQGARRDLWWETRPIVRRERQSAKRWRWPPLELRQAALQMKYLPGGEILSKIGNVASAIRRLFGATGKVVRPYAHLDDHLLELEYFVQLPPCLIGIEACGTAHYWARELTKLGHTVKLMAPQYVAAYRKRGKNDANDAEAICEAVGQPNMRFVATKSEEQQSVLMVHRARSLTMANRTAKVNQFRGLLGEFGIAVPKGVARLRRELPGILEDAENCLSDLAREVLCGLLEQLRELDGHISAYDHKIRALAEASEPARRLMRIEAIGPQTATALVATVGDPHVFKIGRGFAAWLGITPRQHSSGGKGRLGQITRQGDGYLRTLLVHGARAHLRVIDKKTDAKSAWAQRLKQRRHVNVVAVALAAKNARIAWVILAHGTEYRPAEPTAAVA